VWQLVNLTPFTAERTWFADKDGRNHWSVAVKATYSIAPDGTAIVCDEQEKIFHVPEYWGKPGSSSPRWEADLTGPKAATDVLVTGSAYSPSRRPADVVDVRLRVGNIIDKTLRVHGNRSWMSSSGSVRIGPTEPFISVPVTYERAFGGADMAGDDVRTHRIDARNPIGTGFALRSSSLAGKPLPNVECPSSPVRQWSDRPTPAGFGPIACDWSPRRELAGTYDEAWQTTRFPLWAEDFDPGYFQAAPVDQQVIGHLRGGESVELVNMTPTGLWSFALPKMYLSFETQFGREVVNHTGRIGTLTLDPDRNRVVVSWQTFVPCHHRADELDYTVIRQKPYVPLGDGDSGERD
jgi:hypothetical protein